MEYQSACGAASLSTERFYPTRSDTRSRTPKIPRSVKCTKSCCRPNGFRYRVLPTTWESWCDTKWEQRFAHNAHGGFQCRTKALELTEVHVHGAKSWADKVNSVCGKSSSGQTRRMWVFKAVVWNRTALNVWVVWMVFNRMQGYVFIGEQTEICVTEVTAKEKAISKLVRASVL